MFIRRQLRSRSLIQLELIYNTSSFTFSASLISESSVWFSNSLNSISIFPESRPYKIWLAQYLAHSQPRDLKMFNRGVQNYLLIFLSVIYISCRVVFVPSRADLFSDPFDSSHFEDFEVLLHTFRIQPKNLLMAHCLQVKFHL